MLISTIIENVKLGDFKSLARALTVVENDLDGSSELLWQLTNEHSIPVIGITGPPGAGKSTLVNHIIRYLSSEGKRIAILAVDPTSPFNYGSLLGDRIRMASNFNDPNIYIRSIATRGSLGGISAKAIEMSDVLRNSGFDYVFIETVGVGQSEVEISGLADIKIVVLVPEAGDEIQHIKSGIMEIADIFVVNKTDRDLSDSFYNSILKLVKQNKEDIPVFKVIADKNIGISELTKYLIANPSFMNKSQHQHLLKEKAWQLILKHQMKDFDKRKLRDSLTEASIAKNFNLYLFVESFIKNS